MCDFTYRNELPDIFPEAFPPGGKESKGSKEEKSETLQRVFKAFWKEKEPGRLLERQKI